MEPASVTVIRSGLVESVHLADVAVTEGSGRLLWYAGDPERLVFARSSMKPIQAAVSLSYAPLQFTPTEIAVMCASHNAEPVHVAAVRSVLARAGVEESALRTPARRPGEEEGLAEAPALLPINSDCSGKHAGMLAACRAQGWPLDTYRRRDHPLQKAVATAVASAAGMEPSAVGVDGCGLPVHALPLRGMATIYARLCEPSSMGSYGEAAARAVTAMRAVPYLVAGRHRLDTALMEAMGRLVVKSGAEALVCAADLDRKIGVAVRVRDGGARASGPALIQTLRCLDVLRDQDMEALRSFARPAVLGGDQPVGEVVADVELRAP